MGAREVLLRSDSQLLINQLTGRYRVKAPHLQPLHRAGARADARVRDGSTSSTSHASGTRPPISLANLGVDRWLAEGRP